MKDFYNNNSYFKTAMGYPNYPETYPIYTNTQYINRCHEADIQEIDTEILEPIPMAYNRAVPKEILDMIKDSVADEKDDEIFYQRILSQAPTQEDKKIIGDIQNDEKKHNRLLRSLYKELTGIVLPPATATTSIDMSKSYLQNLEKALLEGELEAVKRYRTIMGAMPRDTHYNILMEIMTDELRHANKYNYLIAKNLVH